jgi:uncharacterized membrane protein YidH (DUF202 family)
MNLRVRNSLLVGLILVPVGTLVIGYALVQYHRRLWNIHNRRPSGFHDPIGPSVLSVLVGIGLLIAAVLSYQAARAVGF